jgi:LysR family hydrogen peroxide-inducible transcriptional activator
MNLQQFEYIVAVDRFKNFTKAAEYCHVTQATLSAMVKKLEKELGLILFERRANPIVTTECGKDIIAEARKVLLHADNIRNMPGTIKDNISGNIRLGIIPTIANTLLPIVVKSLIKAFPDLRIEWVEITTDDIVGQLKQGIIDAGILATPLGNKEIEENILYYEKLLVYGNTEKGKEYLLPEEIKKHKVWMLEEGHCLRSQFINLCELEKKKLEEPVHFEPNSFETLINMVEIFGGLTLIPELYYQNLPMDKKEKVLDFHRPYPVREISLVYYRPFAKWRIIEALSSFISTAIKPQLTSSKIKNSELSIVQI